MEDRVLIKENWSEISSISEQYHCRSRKRATSSKKKSHSAGSAETEVIFILASAHFFVRTFLPQWLPVISKKVCKWVLYHLVIKDYYRNLRIISLTLKICVSITFNVAVTMIRCTGSCLNSFCWISSLHFEKFQGSPSLQNFV